MEELRFLAAKRLKMTGYLTSKTENNKNINEYSPRSHDLYYRCIRLGKSS